MLDSQFEKFLDVGHNGGCIDFALERTTESDRDRADEAKAPTRRRDHLGDVAPLLGAVAVGTNCGSCCSPSRAKHSHSVTSAMVDSINEYRLRCQRYGFLLCFPARSAHPARGRGARIRPDRATLAGAAARAPQAWAFGAYRSARPCAASRAATQRSRGPRRKTRYGSG